MQKPRDPPPTPPACLTGDAKRPLLSWARGTDLINAFADGSTRTAHSFDSTAQVDVLTSAGGYLLVSASGPNKRDALLLDAAGVMRWSQSLDVSSKPQLGLEGWATIGGARPQAIDSSGHGFSLQGTPLAAAGPGGWVPTLIQPLGVVALEHPADGTVNTLNAAPVGPGVDVRWAGDRVVYLSIGSPSVQLASARQADQQQQLSLGSGFESAHLVATSGQWVLIESDDASHLIRADVANQQLQPIASVYPEQWSPLEPADGAETLGLDTDGSVLRGFSNDSSSAIFRTSDFGHSWLQIGDPVPATAFKRVMSAQHLAQSWVISAYDVDGALTTLTHAMVMTDGSVAELQAGALGFGAPLNTPLLDGTGACTTYWKPDALDVQKASTADLRVHGSDGSDVSLSKEPVPLTSWNRVVWR